MTPEFAPSHQDALPIWPVWQGQPVPDDADAGTWPDSCGFDGAAGQSCLLPDGRGGVAGALFGLGNRDRADRQRFPLARAAETLPEGIWRLADIPEGMDARQAALGWLLGQYRFTRYKAGIAAGRARLVCPQGLDAQEVQAIAAAEFLTRDLINTPASDMGPQQLEDAARALADRLGASIEGTCR